MPFTDSEEKKIRRLLMSGKSFDDVVKSLDNKHHWTDVQHYAFETGAMNWRGSKKAISIRLNKLVKTDSPAEREKLIEEIQERITYLYNCGKALKDKLDKIDQTLKTVKTKLENPATGSE